MDNVNNYQPINNSTMDIMQQRYDKPKTKFEFHSHRKTLVSLMAVAVLAVGLLAGVLVVQQSQDLEGQAASAGQLTNVALNPSTVTLNQGQTAVIDVIMTSPTSAKLTAADFIFASSNPNLVKIKEVRTATDSQGNTRFGTVLLANPKATDASTGVARLAVGVTCTESGGCAVVPANSGSFRVAQVVVEAVSASGGSAEILFHNPNNGASTTVIAGLNASDGTAINETIAGTLSGASLTVNGGASQASAPSCKADIVGPSGASNKDSKVNALDLSFLISKFSLASNCSAAACAADISGPSGPGNKDNKVNGLDLSYLIQQITQKDSSVQCQ